MGIFRKLIVGALIGAGVEYFARKKEVSSSAAFDGSGEPNNFSNVRNSGPNEMKDDPGQWGKVDEESDASFPASDPPANY